MAFLLAAAGLVYCYLEAEGGGDFYIFLSAAGGLLKHRNIYEAYYVDGYNYFYSVLFALVLEPFYFLPFFWVKFFWLLLNAALYFHLFRLLATSDALKGVSQKKRWLFLVLIFVFSFRFLRENIHTSQITILILWCCICGLRAIYLGRPITGSALLALGINIKLLPIVFLPYLLYRGYFKAFGLTLLFCCVGLLGPSLIIGHQYNLTLLQSWLKLVNPMQQRHILDVDERSFHGLSTLLSTLLVEHVPDTYALPLKRNIADVSLQTLSSILITVRLALVAFVLYFLKWPPFKHAQSKLHLFVEVSYLLLLIPLIFPHQQHYAFLFITPAFALSLFCLLIQFQNLSNGQRVLMTTLLSLIYLFGNLKVILGEFNAYYDHFKILTYGALLLIPALVWVSRRANSLALFFPKD